MSTTPASADATPTELNAADAFGEDESGERDGRHRVEGREDSHDADLTEARGRGERVFPAVSRVADHRDRFEVSASGAEPAGRPARGRRRVRRPLTPKTSAALRKSCSLAWCIGT
jgi:hypothetical protein